MKNKKNIIIIGVLVLIVGAVFFFKFQAEGKNFEVVASEIASIDVYDSCNKINVKPSSDDKIHVTYYDRKDVKYTISTENGVLSISNQTKSNEGGVNAGISFSSTALVIEVPETFTGNFTAKSFDKCEVDDSISFSSVNVESLSEMLGM